jgi:hypothetical protein
MGVSVGGSIGNSYDYNTGDRDIFSLRRVIIEEDIIISSSSYVFELSKPKALPNWRVGSMVIEMEEKFSNNGNNVSIVATREHNGTHTAVN